jgi:hypothetical protein
MAMATPPFDHGYPRVPSFGDLVAGQGVPSNRFPVMYGTHTALIDPGHDLTLHQDPDIIASLSNRLSCTQASRAVPNERSTVGLEANLQFSDFIHPSAFLLQPSPWRPLD